MSDLKYEIEEEDGESLLLRLYHPNGRVKTEFVIDKEEALMLGVELIKFGRKVKGAGR